MAIPTQMSKILSLHQLSMLSREELVSHLLKAQDKIQELEEVVSGYPKNELREEESTFINFGDNSSVHTFLNQPTIRRELLTELQLKLTDCKIDGTRYKKPIHRFNNDEFIVAYEHTGDFPSCDEDLSLPSISAENLDSKAHPDIIIEDGAWYDEEDEDNQVETFPLIPSPVLNTPPYEYIFLTRSNEAKYRIFLNQKLNKVFQEEIHKLQMREEQLPKGQSQYVFDENDDEQDHADHMDAHNQNHLRNNFSASEINGTSSASNVIHCFDPSDVDLELKKIFTERPPITHRIVRRKSRRERGSSVPAVDSYYGTGDLNKVGHASYFIPTLTESERKAIGWKHEYHYGHWKYSALNVPNPKTNQISLHPHKDTEETVQTKHHHNHHHHSGNLPQNPLHHHEINLSETFVGASEDGSTDNHSKVSSKQHSHHHAHEGDAGSDENNDTLSFITLSGCSNDIAQSCHIIPDKSTLRRILKWILPCIKQTTKSDASSMAASNSVCKDEEEDTVPQRSKYKKHHEIEMLVEPSGKLNFPTSHTYISFATTIASLDVKDDSPSEKEKLGKDDPHQQHQESSHKNHNENHEHSGTHHHHHHHHHHGIFHWKKMLSHPSSSKESMSVVGGDVVESVHDKFPTNELPDSNRNAIVAEINQNQHCDQPETNRDEASSTTESENECKTLEPGSGKKKTKLKLKPCKAYAKLLTLKDLGYESVDDDAVGPENNVTSNNFILSGDSEMASDEEDKDCSNPKRERNDKPNNLQGTKREKGLHEQPSRPVTPANRASHTNVSFTDIENEHFGGDDDGSNGYPFSSLSISHQNSVLGTNWATDDVVISPSVSQTDQCIETRFLDPKDLFIAQMNERRNSNGQSEEDPLPFVFDFGNTQVDELDMNNTINGYSGQLMDDDDEDERVFEWMGSNFAEDLEESLGILSNRLETIIQQGKLLKEHLLNQNVVRELADGAQPVDSSPEKVDGQHRITTLNDLEENSLQKT